MLYITTTQSVQLGQEGLHSLDAANSLLQESQLLTTPTTDPLADTQNTVYVTNPITAVRYNGLDLQNGAMWTTLLGTSSAVFASGMHAIHVPAGNHTAKVHTPPKYPPTADVFCLVSVRGEATLKKLEALNGGKYIE